MKINKIELSWFRGTSHQFDLETNLKNIVIYGPNGAGKSTFADALEYIVADGKVGHLAHEYSGSRQEKGIRNSHAPDDELSKIKLVFQNDEWVEAILGLSEKVNFSSEPITLLDKIQSWELQRLILRQDEIADFINKTKTEKYSALLPLLGLDKFETTAENLKNLHRSIANKRFVEAKRESLKRLEREVKEIFGDSSEKDLIAFLKELARDYGVEKKISKTLFNAVNDVSQAIQSKIDSAEPFQKRFVIFQQIDHENLMGRLGEQIKLEEEADKLFDGLLDHHIGVLESAFQYSENVDPETDSVLCPACGQEILLSEFVNHIEESLENLNKARAARNNAIAGRNMFLSSLDQLKRISLDEDIGNWIHRPDNIEIGDAFDFLISDDLEVGISGWINNELVEAVKVIFEFSRETAASAPPSLQKLVDDKSKVETCGKFIEISTLRELIGKIDALIQSISNVESSVRLFTKEKTQAVIDDVSLNIRNLWIVLHPNEPIEEVSLYMPEETGKTIDVELKFFGVDQPSPRLTLSEGHRNSLGLCIFMSLAIMDQLEQTPIILDDIVSSLDREHRGMLVDVLSDSFDDRQLILLTHDRDWYTELRARLPQADWVFQTLRPWENPEIGLQWSTSLYTFDDARALVETNISAAGNTVRSIMDTELAMISEILQIPLPYFRGDKNDRRTAYEFFTRIISEAKKRLKKKDGEDWLSYDIPFKDWKEAITLLTVWANPASHGRTLAKAEFEKLIAVCEKALSHFVCDSCKERFWMLTETKGKYMRCSCGVMRWKL